MTAPASGCGRCDDVAVPLDLAAGDPLLAVAVRDAAGTSVAGPVSAAPAFSITKLFVATAVMRLVESGQLSLEDAASTRVPGVTVREMLGHTGGLPDYATTTAYLDAVTARPAKPWGVEEITAVAMTGRRSPHGRFRYSNLGYWLLGERVEQITGDPLATVLAELVFAAAGLADTRYPTAGDGLTPDGYDTRWAGPAGAAWSTPADLVQYLAALITGGLLSPASLIAMTTTTPVEAGPPWRAPNYGLGLMTDPQLGTLGHAGGGPGYTSAAFALRDGRRYAAAIAADGARTDPTEAVLGLLAAAQRATLD